MSTTAELLQSPVIATILGGGGTVFAALGVFIWRTHIKAALTEKSIQAHKEECDKLRQDTHDIIKSNSEVLKQNAKDIGEIKTCVTRVATKVEALEANQ